MGLNAVLAPTHLVEATDNRWRSIDLSFCEVLRRELDRLWGQAIAIDHQLITTYSVLRDEEAEAAADSWSW